MANPNNTQTIPGNGSLGTSTPAKRKAAQRKTGSPSRAPGLPAPKRASPTAPVATEPTEIVFKELPNPYRQPEPPYIWIDHPQEGDRLNSAEYVIRLGIGGAETAELSIDKGAWRPCRFASGYWWFDWKNIPSGKHTLTARMKTADGRWFRTPPRVCERRP